MCQFGEKKSLPCVQRVERGNLGTLAALFLHKAKFQIMSRSTTDGLGFSTLEGERMEPAPPLLPSLPLGGDRDAEEEGRQWKEKWKTMKVKRKERCV